jgi:hypothetical protein
MVTRIVSGLMPRKADKSFIVYKNKATPYTLERLIMVFGSDVPVSLKNPEQDRASSCFVEMMDRGEATFYVESD